jgi:L-serine dehydratase
MQKLLSFNGLEYNMLSPLDMFNIGIGSSSSHTVGPMKAALEFVTLLEQKSLIKETQRIKVELFGSLALTGEGHGTLLAIISGLSGENPKDITTPNFMQHYADVSKHSQIFLAGKYLINFDLKHDMVLEKNKFLPEHANGMRFSSLTREGKLLLTKEYFSIGGGFILDKDAMIEKAITPTEKVPYNFSNATELFALCDKHGLSIAELALQNELSHRSKAEVEKIALEIIDAMGKSVEHGISTRSTVLPGGINLTRRAPGLYKKLNQPGIETNVADQRLMAMTFAMAVNEENAAFGKIVTAPTNGSAGTIAGVLEYYQRFCKPVTTKQQIEFILTAGVIGVLYKMGASISAAEVGCQGEIGVSCSMAAGALTAVLGGTLKQIERAAEIAMEHSLGMTCDPVNGLVQIPCIERNGVAASRAIDIAKLVLLENGEGNISLDEVIKTMLETGRDMNMHYKETALGGLAVNHVNC